MKLNHRDKLILIGLLVVVIWIIGVLYFIKPAAEDVSTAKETLDAKEIELAGLQQQIEDDKNLPQETQEAYEAAMAVADNFYDLVPQYQAMKNLEFMLEDRTSEDEDIGENEIVNTGMTASTLSSYSLAPFSSTSSGTVTTSIDAIVDQMQPATTTDGTTDGTTTLTASIDMSAYTMEFDFTTTRESLETFLNSLQTNSQKSIVVTSLSLSNFGAATEESSEISGSISLVYMMVQDAPSPDEVNGTATDDSETETVDASAEADSEAAAS